MVKGGTRGSQGLGAWLLLILSVYSLSILDFCTGSPVGRIGWRQGRTLLRAKKKVDPKVVEKRRQAAEARALALKKAEDEKRKLQGLEPAPAPVAPVPSPAAARPARPARRKGVDALRQQKRLLAAQDRMKAKKRAEEERKKLEASAAKPSARTSSSQDFSEMTVVEIKAELRKRGLKVSGKKQELIQRLKGEEVAVAPVAVGAETTMKVAELREALKGLGLKTSGRKAELLARLQAAPASGSAGAPAVGQRLKGRVARVSKWGAFVDIGLARPALVRTSRLAERHVRDPLEVVRPGEEVDVWVYRIAPDGLMGLSMIEYPPSHLQDPVSAFEGISRETWFKGKVRYSGSEEFFVDVKGVQGLLRRSQVAYPEKVSDGQEIQVRVLEVIANTGTLRLSAKPTRQ